MIYKCRSLIVSTLLLGATCWASTPNPVDKLELAQLAVDRAAQAGATETAPIELAAARDKLAKSQQLAQDSSHYLAARRLAEEAQADGELAEAKARAVHAEKTAAEFDRSLAALRTEAESAHSQN